MPTVFVNPTYSGADRADGGIRRVSEAMNKYLPVHGWQITYGPANSDIIANHGTLLAEYPGSLMVAHCHGLYWQDYTWPLWAEDANRRVTEVIVRADEVVAPSKWVAGAIARGALRNSHVIYHGVDTDDWTPTTDSARPFALWNKARKDAVSDPADMQTLAQMLPNIPFVSTFGNETLNVKIIGSTPYEKMKELTRHAWVYLATTRETFGIGTLEALSAGIPVVGWDYGGQSEIIIQNETGILVPKGDFGLLAEATQMVWNDRQKFSQRAREDALARWQWPDKIKQYADLYWELYNGREKQREKPKVSIIVTAYNLAKFLPETLASVSAMRFRNWECIIVDDCSEDNTEAIARDFEQRGSFTYHKTPKNLGLSGARNYGFQFARGEYIVFLDADDMIEGSALQEIVDGLDNDRGVHIAYGGLDTVVENGAGRQQNPWPTQHFSWAGQIAHLNQLPYASVMRRSVFERVGGYRTRDWRAEDASLWLRATSFGFRAERLTNRSLLVYRMRSGSKSGEERNRFRDADGDWTAWFPWRTGAASGAEGEQVLKRGVQPNPLVVPFAAQGEPPSPHQSWPVHHHSEPLVSVVIPVGPGHKEYLVDALDSLIAQTFGGWEAIVVNDTGEPLTTPGAPWARIVSADPLEGNGRSVGGRGAGAARNVGIKAARGQLIFFLDADDWIRPDALEKMVQRYSQEGGYIYSDCAVLLDDDASKVYTQKAGLDWAAFTEDPPTESQNQGGQDVWRINALPYDRSDFLHRGYGQGRDGAHSVSIMVAKVDLDAVGGFDEGMPFWEDWEIALRLAKLGVCGQHISEPLLSYRFKTGNRRRAAKEVQDHLRKILEDRYSAIAEGAVGMCNCGGGGPTLQQRAQAGLLPFQRAAAAAKSQRTGGDEVNAPGVDAVQGFRETDMVRLQYIGRKQAPVPYTGRVTGTVYRACRDPLHDVIVVDPRDVEHLVSTRDFAVLDVQHNAAKETVQW